MTSSGGDPDIEAQTPSVTESQPAIVQNLPPTTNTAYPELSTIADQPQATNSNQHYNGNAPVQQTAENPQVQRDENQGDSSDGLWSMYLTEAEKQDTQVTESWKGDTDGILVFTGLFSATVAAFIIESYKTLSPDPSVTTNAILAQISVQLVNISNGTPLASVAVQSGQPFKPTASAVRVNVLWFLSLILSLNCALSATLMQQWARRYKELAQRRGAFHRRGRMRAYIFDGINKFGMARAIATMPTLLHISVFLFFAGLVEFLFPIYTPVAYTALGCIIVFVLVYANLTVLPTICLNCPYATPLSGLTWRTSQFSVFVFLWTVLKIDGLFLKLFSKLWRLANQHVPEPHEPKRWRETLNKQVKIYRQRLSQSLRRNVELCAYRAESMVVTSALEWTLTALDEDKEIEDFAARVPGFFDSRVVPDATSAVLSLMSHPPNTDPVFGSRLHDLLKTCIPGTSLLDEKMRKHRLWVCLNCLWYFGRAYNFPGASQPLPSYFPDSLIPEITRRVQTEEDPALRVVGRCVVAVIRNKLATDLRLKALTIRVNDGVLTCLSPVLGAEGYDLEFLYPQPGTVALANTIFLASGEVGTLAADAFPPDVLDVVQQTFTILSRALLDQEKTELQLGQKMPETDDFYEKFGPTLVPRLLYFLDTCMRMPSRLTDEVRTSCLRMCLKRLWFIGRAFNWRGKSAPLPSELRMVFSDPEMIRCICQHEDPAVRAIGRCVGALIANNLAVNSRTIPVSHAELECLLAILGTEGRGMELIHLLRQPGAVSLATIISLILDETGTWFSNIVPSNVLDVLQQTIAILSQPLLAELQLEQTATIFSDSDGKFEFALGSCFIGFLNTCIRMPSSLTRTSCLRMCLKGMWRFGRVFDQLGNSMPVSFYIPTAFAVSMTISRIRFEPDLASREIGRCVGALVVNKLAANLKSRTGSITAVELEYLRAILDIEMDDAMHLLRHPGAIEFTNMVLFALDSASAEVPPDVLDVIQETFSILSQDLPDEFDVKMWPDRTDTLNDSDGITFLSHNMQRRLFHMKNLWNVVRASSERGNSVPLPFYICVAFTSSVMSSRTYQDTDPPTALIGRCIGAIIVTKFVSDLKSGLVLATNEERHCLLAILGTSSRNVALWLRHPGATELAGVVSLISDAIRFLVANVVPSDVMDIFQQTLDFVSRALTEERIARQQPYKTISPISAADGDFERFISSHLKEFPKVCVPNTSLLTIEARTSCLRALLKSLWYFARLYHQFDASVPIPSYFSLVHAGPEITHLIQTELDPSTRVIGRCFEALVVGKLVEGTNLLTDESVACISAILGTEHHIVWHWLKQPGAIGLRNIISVFSDEIDTFVADELPADVVEILQQTLSIIAKDIVRGRVSADEDLYMEQVVYFHSIFSMVADAGAPDWLKYRLEWILSQLPAVEDRNGLRRNDLTSDGQFLEYSTDDSSLRSSSNSTGQTG